MGLKTQPEFETQAETATATKEPAMTTATPDAVAAATKAASTAIAKAASTAVGAVTKFSVAFKEQNNVFDTQTVEGLSMAAPRIKGEQGSLFMGDVDLGAELQFELISYNHRWAIGNGEKDKESADFFKVSYDNETISGSSTTVKDYLDSLKAQGFAKAKSSTYMDIWGFVTWSEKKGPVAIEQRELACLQASQTSLGSFTAFVTTQGLLQSKGLTTPFDVIEVHAEKRANKGGDKYTNFSFSRPKQIK